MQFRRLLAAFIRPYYKIREFSGLKNKKYFNEKPYSGICGVRGSKSSKISR
jgi:hypothetical protein